LQVKLTTAANTASVQTYKVYDSAEGSVSASASFSVKDVYAALGVASQVSISNASDSSNVSASVNALLKNVDAAIRAFLTGLQALVL